MKQVDIIIPTYKPGHKFLELLERLSKQTLKAEHIIVINTVKEYYDSLVYGADLERKYPELEVHHIVFEQFDHAATRNEAVKKYSKAPVFIMMTQDAVPADPYLTERLVNALVSSGSAVSYARQLAGVKADPVEKYTRHFNYPADSQVKSKADKDSMGIKTYFCSNVCAAYDRNIFDMLGEFRAPAIFNEDMVYAAGAVNAGYSVTYAADAKVYHSHNYTGKQQFHRNFDLAVSQAEHPEIFSEMSSETEGSRYVKDTVKYLRSKGYNRCVIPFIWVCGCRYIGYKLGKNYRRLPESFIMRCTMNRAYWLKQAPQSRG